MSVLTIENLRLRRGEREILRGVNASAAAGELVALMGLSGGGKTTVLRCVAALETFENGVIDVGGVVLRPGPQPPRATLRDLRTRVGMVFQLHYLFEHLSAMDNVTLAPTQVAHKSRTDAERRALELLDSLGVAHRRNALPRELSGG
jgi:ABC-type polar amino acid transport system ATPase subunit